MKMEMKIIEKQGLYYNLDSVKQEATVINDGSYQDNLTNVKIPESITHENITYKVTSIGKYAFHKCFSLKRVTIGNSVISIGESAFEYCDGIKKVIIGESVKAIGEDAFFDCSGLSKVEIPDSVETIGEGAFACCYELTNLTIGNSVKTIESVAFMNCYGLTNVTIPDSVTHIGHSAFFKCRELESVLMSKSVTSIEDDAFDGCSKLTNVTIPVAVSDSTKNNIIGEGTFLEKNKSLRDKRVKANFKILEKIKEEMVKHPDLRFLQLLINMNIINDDANSNLFNEEPEITLKKTSDLRDL